MTLALPPALVRVSTGATDPIRYYTRPGIGWLYRRRIEMGLEMIPRLPPGARLLEVGYGAGIVLYNLSSRGVELHGLDLDADPIAASERLRELGIDAELKKGSVLNMGDLYADGFFDLVVCFSVMEHIADSEGALAEMGRVLKPGGSILIGMPAVNKFMEYAFQAIGFKGIEDHHITTPRSVLQIAQQQPAQWRVHRRSLPSGVPLEIALYHTFRLDKVA